MDLVDSFVPSFKRKAPEAQSFVKLKKVKEPFNVNDIDVEMEENLNMLREISWRRPMTMDRTWIKQFEEKPQQQKAQSL